MREDRWNGSKSDRSWLQRLTTKPATIARSNRDVEATTYDSRFA
ncbi:hypothetical protein [Hyella patelloides]|nr:hypothetical protein [Hyella patelloides]